MSLYSKQRARTAVFHTAMLRPPAQIGGLLAYVLLVRLLSEAEYGVYNLLYALLPLLTAAASFGLEHTLRRYQPEYLRQGEHRLADLIVRRISVLRFVATACVLALILLAWPKVAPFFKLDDYRTLFLLFCAVALTHFQCALLTIALSSHLLQKHSLGVQAVFSLGKAAAYATVGYGLGLDLWKVLLIDLALYVVLFIGLKVSYVRYAERKAGTLDRLPRAERWRLFKYGLFYNFNDAGTLPLQTRTDNFFIVAYLDAAAVGAYAFATQLGTMVLRATPLKFLESVVQPLFFSLDRDRAAERVKIYFSLLMTFSLLVTVPLFLFIACFHRPLVETVFAGKFLEYSYLLAVVFLFTALNGIDFPVALVAQLKEKAHIILASKIFALYNIGALLVLIPRLGVLGAVLASGTAMLFKNLFIWWFVRDLAVWKGAWRFVLATVAAWAPYPLLSVLWIRAVDHPAIELAGGALLWAVFFGLYLRYAALTAEQKALLGSLFPGRESRLLRAFGVAH